MEWIIGLVIFVALAIWLSFLLRWQPESETDSSPSTPKHKSGNEATSVSETSSEYEYYEFDQGWGSRSGDCTKKVNQVTTSFFKKGWKLHSFNVTVVKGFILFEKQRYCFMFEKVTAAV